MIINTQECGCHHDWLPNSPGMHDAETPDAADAVGCPPSGPPMLVIEIISITEILLAKRNFNVNLYSSDNNVRD